MTVGQRLYLGAAAEGASETGVQWFVLGAESGSVTPEGLYTAPYRPGTTFVRTRALADPSVTAATVVTVHAEPQARELRVESPAPEGSGSVRMTAIFQGGTGEVSPGVGPVESGRSFEVKPAATTTYTLRVSNDLGERAETSVQVEVPGPPEAPGIYAPSEVQAGLQQVAWLASENLAGCEWSIEGGSFLGGDPHPGSKAVAFVAAGGTAFALKARLLPSAHGQHAQTRAVTYEFTGAVAPRSGSEPQVELPSFLSAGKEPWVARVHRPQPDTDYLWRIQNGHFSDSAETCKGESVAFFPGAKPGLSLSCEAQNRTTGIRHSATLGAVLTPEPERARIVIPEHIPVQLPQTAYVEKPMAGNSYRWALEGGTFAGGAAVVEGLLATFTVAKPGPFTLRCTASNLAGAAAAPAFVIRTAVPATPLDRLTLQGPAIVTLGKGFQTVSVADPQPSYTYQWSILGGTLEGKTGPVATFQADAARTVILLCRVTDPATGRMRTAQLGVNAVWPPVPPSIEAPLSVQAGSAGTAQVIGGCSGESYEWEMDNATLEQMSTAGGTAAVAFTAGRPGPYSVRCWALNAAGQRSEASVLKGMVEEALLAPKGPAVGPAGPSDSGPSAPPASSLPHAAGVPPGPGAGVPFAPPLGSSAVPNTPPPGSSAVPNAPSLGSSAVPNAPSLGSSAVPNAPPLGSSAVPNAPSLGSSAVPNAPSLGSSAVPNAPPLGSSAVPNAPRLGSSAVPNAPLLGSSVVPNAPSSEASAGLVIPGIDYLAGDSQHIKKGYYDGPWPNGAAWRHITGLLWLDGDLFFSEGMDHTIRKAQRGEARVVPFAGLRGSPQLAREGEARLNGPGPLACLPPYLYVVDSGSHSIKRMLEDGSGIPEVFAGTPGVAGLRDGAGAQAQFNNPADIVASRDLGLLFVADQGNGRIRMITLDGQVQTLPQAIADPQGLALDAQGKLFVSSAAASVIQVLEPQVPHDRATPWVLRPLAGVAGTRGFQDGPMGQALFDHPLGLALDGEVLLVADSGNNLIRRIDLHLGSVATFAGNPHARQAGRVDGPLADAMFAGPSRLALGAPGELFVGDQKGRSLRRIGHEGMVQTLGGNATESAAGARDGQAGDARFSKPLGVVVDRAGTTFVADRDNHAIRRIAPSGAVDTFAGGWEAGDADGQGASARFQDPAELALDGTGRLFVLEPSRQRLRVIDPEGRVTTSALAPTCIAACPLGKAAAIVVALEDAQGSNVAIFRGAAQERVVANVTPAALALNAMGEVYVLTESRPQQKVVLGKYAQPGGPGTAWQEVATLSLGPQGQAGQRYGMPEIHGMAADSKGRLFLADTANGLIWRVESNLHRAELVAGQYPFLESTRGPKGLGTPLYQVHRIAVTAMDHLIVTAGHALLRITAPGSADAPWTPPARDGRPASPAVGGGKDLVALLGDALKNPKLRKSPSSMSGSSKVDLSPLARRMAEQRAAVAGDDDDFAEESAPSLGTGPHFPANPGAQAELQAAAEAEEARVRRLEAQRLARLAARSPGQIDNQRAMRARSASVSSPKGTLLDQIRNRARGDSSQAEDPSVKAAQAKRAAKAEAARKSAEQEEAKQRARLLAAAEAMNAKNAAASKGHNEDAEDGWD